MLIFSIPMTYKSRLSTAQSQLAPYAVPITGVMGRQVQEESDEARFPFQRDRDRIIHTNAFRRLKGKTQVFIASAHDHRRTRLTHTLEVTQISRDIARTLRLNEDLAECIALAHDLGHPPFGHAGEEALDQWMKSHGSHFEHNAQSYRIVTKLEHHSKKFQGLNLNQEVLEGLLKHQTIHDHPRGDLTVVPTLEAQLVNIADEIAYTGHDCEDGLKSGVLSLDALLETELCKQAYELSSKRGSSLRGGIVHLLISDLYAETDRRLSTLEINSLEDVYAASEPLVSFSIEMEFKLKALRAVLYEKLYFSLAVKAENERGMEMVRVLCDHFYASPTDKVLSLQKKYDATLEEAVKDYVSGMSDQFAVSSYEGIIDKRSSQYKIAS